mmetsp:Transcript_13842/g.34442  ORF Transcript_13842/g.34442 Transcript_13842/m.34442 type:complete len:252 (-) Transcript_13842:1812-2567(-)
MHAEMSLEPRSSRHRMSGRLKARAKACACATLSASRSRRPSTAIGAKRHASPPSARRSSALSSRSQDTSATGSGTSVRRSDASIAAKAGSPAARMLRHSLKRRAVRRTSSPRASADQRPPSPSAVPAAARAASASATSDLCHGSERGGGFWNMSPPSSTASPPKGALGLLVSSRSRWSRWPKMRASLKLTSSTHRAPSSSTSTPASATNFARSLSTLSLSGRSVAAALSSMPMPSSDMSVGPPNGAAATPV